MLKRFETDNLFIYMNDVSRYKLNDAKNKNEPVRVKAYTQIYDENKFVTLINSIIQYGTTFINSSDKDVTAKALLRHLPRTHNGANCGRLSTQLDTLSTEGDSPLIASVDLSDKCAQFLVYEWRDFITLTIGPNACNLSRVTECQLSCHCSIV